VEQVVGRDREAAEDEEKYEHYQEARWQRAQRPSEAKENANPETSKIRRV
jgi:hypothetical protein